MTIHTDEDDEFARIERENAMKGQPYHFDVFVSVSQRNQVLEEAAKVCEETTASWTQYLYNEGCIDCAKAIRGMKK